MLYTIESGFVKEMLKQRACITMGEVLKRLEIGLSIPDAKAEIKEVIHENFREIEKSLGYFSSGCNYVMRQKGPV